MRAHSEAITIETEKSVSPEDVKALMLAAPGVELVDDVGNNEYPMPLHAAGKYDVEVGRIRQSIVFNEKGIDLFVSGDQLLRGAALNAVLIAEGMIDAL